MLDRRSGFLISSTLAAAATRLLPHPPNFTAVGALALFGGAAFASRAVAFTVPLLAVACSDVVLYTFVYGWTGLWQTPYVYAGFAACTAIGRLLRGRRRGVVSVGLAAVAAAVTFFLVANVGVWAHTGIYPPTAGGLFTCYVAAVPYLQNMLLANLVYAALLFGALAIAERRGLVTVAGATTR